jgi:large subunit ribosomal protein L29
MNASEIRELSTDELRSKMNDARHELMNLRFQIITGQLTDTSRLKVSRRLIARYETLLHEREQAEEGSK